MVLGHSLLTPNNGPLTTAHVPWLAVQGHLLRARGSWTGGLRATSVAIGPWTVDRYCIKTHVCHVCHERLVCVRNKIAFLTHTKLLIPLDFSKVIHSVCHVCQHFSNFRDVFFSLNFLFSNSESTENGDTHDTQLILKEKFLTHILTHTPSFLTHMTHILRLYFKLCIENVHKTLFRA
jgi:hypothetical protein